MPEPDSFQPQRMQCNSGILLKSHARTGIGGPSKQQRVVLWRRKTVVGGTKMRSTECLLVNVEFPA